MSRIHLFYCAGHIVSVQHASSAVGIFRAMEVPLAQQASGAHSLLATDRANSPLLISTDSITQSNAFSPYGHLPHGPATHLLGYNGERLDLTGLYFLGNGNRAYSPALQRFISPDPIGIFFPGNHNTYGYCKGDSINHSDPSGNMFRRFTSRVGRFFRSKNSSAGTSDALPRRPSTPSTSSTSSTSSTDVSPEQSRRKSPESIKREERQRQAEIITHYLRINKSSRDRSQKQAAEHQKLASEFRESGAQMPDELTQRMIDHHDNRARELSENAQLISKVMARDKIQLELLTEQRDSIRDISLPPTSSI